MRLTRGTRRLSIGARWVLSYSVATSMLLMMLLLLVYNRIETLLLDRLEEELRQVSHSISEAIARDPDDLSAVGALIEATIASSALEKELAIELYDDQIQLLLQRDILAPFPRPLRPEDLDVSVGTSIRQEQREAPHPYFVSVETNGQGFTRAAIYGGPSLGELNDIRDVFVYVMVIGMGLTALLGWLLAREGMRPISEISATAMRVSAHGSDGWLPIRGTGDELDQLAETLNRMLERLRHSADSMKRFAAQAAHELLTPLGVARTRIEVTLTGAEDMQDYRGVLEAVLADVEHLGMTVNGVLDIARSGAGLDPERVEVISLSELLANIVEFYQVVAADHDIALHPPPEIESVVSGDPIWLNRLFSNLVDNAIKFSSSGGSIDFVVDEGLDWVCVSIRDHGVGISPEDRQRIFDHFFRAERERSSGHGLGLALAMEVVRAHGGTIQHEGPESGGSIFHVRLPVSKANRSAVVST
ncbi:MAG: HAMP domain-containing histidine kinase [bacterium]|nr:HAMP domain-containing histidine kinase [bacterium]